MNEKIIAYLEEHGKVNINELAAGLDMLALKNFQSLSKRFQNWKAKENCVLMTMGTLLFVKNREEKRNHRYGCFSC